MPKYPVTIFTIAFLCACNSNKRHLIITNTSERGTIYVAVSINGKAEFNDTIPKAESSISYIDHVFEINVDSAEIEVDIPNIGLRKIEQVNLKSITRIIVTIRSVPISFLPIQNGDLKTIPKKEEILIYLFNEKKEHLDNKLP